MPKKSLLLGLLFLCLAVVILVFADGLRRWYSGFFFLLMGLWVVLRARFGARKEEPDQE